MGKNESTSPVASKLLSLEAYLDSIEGRPEEALEKLEGESTPEILRRRLLILRDSERFDEAANLVRESPIHEGWIEFGVLALAAVGANAEALTHLTWARERPDPTVWQRSALNYFDGSFFWLFRNRKDGIRIVPGSLNSEEFQSVSALASVLEPAYQICVGRGSISTELESQLLQKVFECAYLLEDKNKSQTTISILERYVPIPLKVAQAVIQKVVAPPVRLVERIRDDYPGQFGPQLLICLLNLEVFEKYEEVWSDACRLESIALSEGERTELCNFLSESMNLSDPVQLEKTKEITTRLLGEDCEILLRIKAEELLQLKDHEGVISLVNQAPKRDNPRWLRISADAHRLSKNFLRALELYEELSQFAPSPQVLRRICSISQQLGLEDREFIALQRLVSLVPKEAVALKRIAWLSGKRSDFSLAAKYFRILNELEPNNIDVLVNLALSLSFDHQFEASLEVLNNAKVNEDDELLVVRSKAQILQAANRSAEAFALLRAEKRRFGEEPQFLSSYMSLAYEQADENEANLALQKLLELREKGLVDDALLRPASMDELRDLISNASKRHDLIRRHELEGKCPWIMSAEMMREAPTWAWKLRTQPADWLWDEPLNRASYCIYSSNGFRVNADDENVRVLGEIACAQKGTPVAVDLSALISLHALGLLKKAGEFFGKLYIPAAYLPKMIEDQRKLFPHQRSQKLAAERIKTAIDSKLILDLEALPKKERPGLLSEYADEGDEEIARYRIRDLLDCLHGSGFLSDSELERAKKVSQKTIAAESPAPTIKIGDLLHVDELTLVTLSGVDLLDRMLSKFVVYISKHDAQTICNRARAFTKLEEARIAHANLWEEIESNKALFEFVPSSSALKSDSDELDRGIAMSAYFCAKEQKCDLLADDRVCQGLLMNESKERPHAAFGTDRLIVEMGTSNLLSPDETVDALLQLMEWRYRFILLSADQLGTLARRYKSHPPGSELRRVARYVHDCMRDFGLFGGLEDTSPPTSLAIRLYLTWVQNISEFVMDFWLLDDTSEETAEELTRWVVAELIPSPPRVLDERGQATIASLTAKSAITRALIRSGNTKKPNRANRGLRSLAMNLGVSEREYLDTVVGVSHHV